MGCTARQYCAFPAFLNSDIISMFSFGSPETGKRADAPLFVSQTLAHS